MAGSWWATALPAPPAPIQTVLQWLIKSLVVSLCAAGLGQQQAWGQPTQECPQSRLNDMATPGHPQYALSDPATHLANLAPLEPLCLRTVAFYRLRAQLRQATGQYLLALEDTERALLLDPDHPGTQLDHAQLLLLVGDTVSAIDLLASISARTDVPEHLTVPLLELQQRLVAWQQDTTSPVFVAHANTSAANRSRWQVAHSFGRDSNINRAPAGGELTLTLPSGDAEFALGEESRRQHSSFMQTQLQWQGMHSQDRALWMGQAELRHRHTPNAINLFTQADLGLTWLQNPQAARQWVWNAAASGSLSAQQTAYAAVRTGLQHQWVLPICSPNVGLEAERRQYPGVALQNGRYQGAVFGLTCGAWQWQWRQGTDSPAHAARPGGQHSQQEARLVWRGQSGVHGWVLEHRWQRQTDSSGYSPLLTNNAQRRIYRQALQAEWAAPAPFVAGAAQAFVQLEWVRQNSNLVLFAFGQRRVQMGLRWSVD